MKQIEAWASIRENTVCEIVLFQTLQICLHVQVYMYMYVQVYMYMYVHVSYTEQIIITQCRTRTIVSSQLLYQLT